MPRVADRLDASFLRRLNRPWVAILAVTAIAAVVRMWGLSSPPSLVFDENYYAKAACIFVGGTDEVCRVESPNERAFREQEWDVGSFVHTPLGKWTIPYLLRHTAYHVLDHTWEMQDRDLTGEASPR